MRRRGFTLIELLVVIAIIGILAAMLFPVFARARESARKAQCLTNVKNIALAFQMYATDYDTNGYQFPYGNDARVTAAMMSIGVCNVASPYVRGNPYLREPVILDDYIKSRDIWKCPSAKVMNGAGFIVPMGRDGLWWNSFVDGWDTSVAGPLTVCSFPRTFPSGWGGEVTDSFTQGMAVLQMGAGAQGAKLVTAANVRPAFVQGIGMNDNLHFIKNSEIEDAAKFIVCGDVGNWPTMWSGPNAAFPDKYTGVCICKGEIVGYNAPADVDNCAWSVQCGLTQEQQDKAVTDTQFQKSLTRHVGGSNIGFADGHAKWYPSKVLLTQVNRDWGPVMPVSDVGVDNMPANGVPQPVLYGWGSTDTRAWK